jgi:L-ascorbate metabolism protein UlaG (beta-lactamase superfamily)
MKLTFLGHAAVSLRLGAHEVLIDPYLTGNPKAAARPARCPADDRDHPRPRRPRGRRGGHRAALRRRIVSAVEIVAKLGRDGGDGVDFLGANIGGRVAMPFGALRFTPAWHSSGFADGSYGGMPMGVIVEIGDRRVYHAGDTGLFGDMALIGRHGLDVALLPIGGHFTMDPGEALEAVRLLRPRHVIPDPLRHLPADRAGRPSPSPTRWPPSATRRRRRRPPAGARRGAGTLNRRAPRGRR